MELIKIRLYFFINLLLLGILYAIELPRKKLAGPPEEFPFYKLPTPTINSLKEESAMFFKNFKYDKINQDTILWDLKLLVDNNEQFSFSFFSPAEKFLHFTLKDPQGSIINLEEHAIPDNFPIGLYHVSCTTYIFDNPSIGEWTLIVKPKDLEKFINFMKSRVIFFGSHDAAVLLWNKNPMKIYSHLNTYNLKVGQDIGLVATLIEQNFFNDSVSVTPIKLKNINNAIMDIIYPDGKEINVDMKDDGLNYDIAANDGIYGAFIKATEVGNYRVQSVLSGTKLDGTRFIRTSQHIITVIDDKITLNGLAFGEMQKSNNRMDVNIGVKINQQKFNSEESLFRAYTEIWAKNEANEDIPVCWISGIVNVEQSKEKGSFVTLELDLRWLSRVNAKEPITLKNVYIQDAYTHIPLSQFDQISLKTFEITKLLKSLHLDGTIITKEMKQGIPPPNFNLTRTSSVGSGALVLLHGYCADGNPWEKFTEWTNGHFFNKKKANLLNEEFAQIVAEFAQERNLDTYSIVGHSQGGMVAVHLLNYYFTGLDKAANGRIIQSVGSPYQGCTVAGSAANLGKLFGISCGENFDLTVDGAKLWLAGISLDVRKHIYYYTTTYQQGTFFGDYCNLAINFLLEWPNDGTAELDYSNIPNGNNMGNKQKW